MGRGSFAYLCTESTWSCAELSCPCFFMFSFGSGIVNGSENGNGNGNGLWLVVFVDGFNGRVCTQFSMTSGATFACVTSIRLAVIDWPGLLVLARSMEGAVSNKCVNTIKRWLGPATTLPWPALGIGIPPSHLVFCVARREASITIMPHGDRQFRWTVQPCGRSECCNRIRPKCVERNKIICHNYWMWREWWIFWDLGLDSYFIMSGK